MWKKILLVLIAGTMLAFATVVIVSIKQGRDNEKNLAIIDKESRAETAPPPVNIPPSASPDAQGGTEPGMNRKSRMELARSASTSFEAIQEAMFLPPDLLKQTVRQLAVPEIQQKLIDAYIGTDAHQGTGPYLAKLWGWNSIEDVLPNHSVKTDRFRIESATRTRATVSLFTITGWRVREVTDGNVVQVYQYWVPRIQVINLKRVKGKWLYLGTQDPKPGESPKPLSNPTYEEAIASFVPYLQKGFEEYVLTEDG